MVQWIFSSLLFIKLLINFIYPPRYAIAYKGNNVKRKKKIGIYFKAGIIILVTLAFIMPGSSTISKTFNREEIDRDHSVTIKQAQEMIESQETILLDVRGNQDSPYVNGAIPITLTDLGCDSCLYKKIGIYENIIVYSENNKIRTEALNLLDRNDFNVYVLTEKPNSDDFSYVRYSIDTENEYNDEDSSDEIYFQVDLAGTDARVQAYERNGRIKRLFGEAFSFGETPDESAELFLNSNANLFGVDSTDLIPIGPFPDGRHIQPIMYEKDQGSYKFMGVYYAQYKNGIPVYDSRIVLLVRNEVGYPLVLVSVDLRNLEGFEVNLGQALNPDFGISNAKKVSPNLEYFTEPELVIWAGVDDMIVEPILTYFFIGENIQKYGDDTPEKELFITDVTTGDILYNENLILSVDVIGNVQGMATEGIKADICNDEIPFLLPYARVNIGGTVAYADENGDFIIPNPGSSAVDVESRLRGQWFRVFNQGTGGDAVLYAYDVIPPGPVYFMHNELNTDEYLRAQVNGYLQANVVRDYTLTYNPEYPGLQQSEFPVNVNLNDDCNAYYDYSSINFFRSGGGCANSAFSTVIHHEYGHHLVAMAGSGQDAYGEGMGDVMGVLITDMPELAWGFFGDCNDYMRTANNDLQYPCSGEIHYCGQLISGCVWDTRNELLVTNPTTYRDIISNLAINAMLLHTGSSITPAITIDYLTLDDDNGNIYDGTPHYNEIAAGFGAHNMDAPPLLLLEFAFPDGLPEYIIPEGGTTIRTIVDGVISEPEPDTGVLYFNEGEGYEEIPMTEIEPNIYDAIFPDTECGTLISYYFSAETTDEEIQYWPWDAPDNVFYTISANEVEVVLTDDFELDLGWTVENSGSLTAGAWERGAPIGGGGRGDPPTDYDDSGNCYLTDNAYGNSDVDDGYTWLISPTIDLNDGSNAKIDYALWYTNNFGGDPNNDYFKVYVSDNDGTDWTLAETIGPTTISGWKEYSFMVGDFVSLTDQIKVRFEVSDLAGGSIVEAGIDAISATIIHCGEPTIPNLDCEGTLSWTDIEPGSIVTGEIIIENIGEPISRLDWEVAEWPNWGTWTFEPDSGINLKPDEGELTIQIEVIAPDDPETDFEGEVKIENSENPDDYCTIEVSLATPENQNSQVLQFLERFLERFPHSSQIMRTLLGL